MRLCLTHALPVIGFVTLLLAACGAPSDEPAPTPEPADVDSQEAHNDTDAPLPGGPGLEPTPELADDVDGSEAVAGDGTDAAMIPARFQGTWDYIEGTCSPESDMFIEVSAREMMFYESVGSVKTVTLEDADAVVTLAMIGEGETWEQSTRLALESDGSVTLLHTTPGDEPKRIDEYPRKKCS